MAKNKITIDDKKLKGSILRVLDTSSIMRYNYVPLSEAESGEDQFKKPQQPWMKYQKRELSWEVDGEVINTSSLYGLLRFFDTYGFDNHFVFCFDTPKNFRKSDSSEYKAGREKADEDYFKQINIAREMLENVGFRCHSVSGFEADDFIVETVNRNKDYFDNVVVHSNDFDMSQTIDKNVIFKNVNKKHGDINLNNYEEMLGCPYNSILLYKSMVGDSSDNINGIKRFGPKAFYKFIEDEGIYGDLSNVRNRNLEYQILKDTVYLTDEQRKQALDSLKLVLPRVPKGYSDWDPKQNINKELFEMYLLKYGMKSIAKKLNNSK